MVVAMTGYEVLARSCAAAAARGLGRTPPLTDRTAEGGSQAEFHERLQCISWCISDAQLKRALFDHTGA